MDKNTRELYRRETLGEIELYIDALAERLYALLDESTRNGVEKADEHVVNNLRDALNRALGRVFQFLKWGGDRYGKEADKCPLAHLSNVYEDQGEAFRFFHILKYGGSVLIRNPHTGKTSHYDVNTGFYGQHDEIGVLKVATPEGREEVIRVPSGSAVWLLPKNRESLFIGEFIPVDISEDPDEDEIDELHNHLWPSSSAEIFLAKDKTSGDTKICKFRGIDRENKSVIVEEMGVNGQDQTLPIKTYKFGHLEAA